MNFKAWDRFAVLLVFAFIGVCMLFSMQSQFLMNKENFNKLLVIGFTIYGMLFLPVIYRLFCKFSDIGSYGDYSPPTIVFLVFMPIAILGLSLKGLPVLLHSFYAEKSEMIVKRHYKTPRYDRSSGYRGRGSSICNGKIFIRGDYSFILSSHLCIGNKEKWQELRSAKEFKLYGTTSNYGFLYSKIEKHAK